MIKKWLTSLIDKSIKQRLPNAIKTHFVNDEGFIILYSIINARAELLYFLANKHSESVQKKEFWLSNEKKRVIEILQGIWPDKSLAEIEELVNEFYK